MFYIYKEGNDKLIEILKDKINDYDLEPTKEIYRSLISYIKRHKAISIFDLDFLIKNQNFKYDDFKSIL